jgi:RNA polymerase sigma factor (sigma-70 family)
MPIDQPRDALQQPRGTTLLRDGSEMTDGQLLERFITHRDEAAMETLVRRHGPMVLGVCCRVLGHPQDAEDAFQATFLVLVRKAASITQRELLGNWLYGVAYRTALDARAAAARRRTRERQVNPMPEPEAADRTDVWRDLRPLLDRELNRLPEKYRVPIVLCDLEGGTRRDVAQQLDIPVGTLSGRLTTARAMLAKRLARHGLALSGWALIAALSPSAASAAVPSPLVASTVAAATAIAAGQGAAGVVSAHVAALAEGVRKAMLMKTLKIATAVLLTVVVVGAAAVVVQADREATGAVKVLKLDGRGRVVAWSPDGKTLAVREFYEPFFPLHFARGGGAIKLWDVAKGQVKQTLIESTEKGFKELAFGEVAFSADGKTIAVTVSEWKEVIRPNGREIQLRAAVKIWDAKTLALKQTLEGDAQLVCVALSLDGRLVAAGDPSKKAVKLWNAQTGKLERTLETGASQPWSLAFSPDSKALVVGGQKDDHSGEVQLWDAQTWKLKHVLKHDKFVNTVAFSAKGKTIASGSGDDLVRLWDAPKGELIHSLKGAQPGTRCVAFSPDGRTIAAGGTDGKVRLWDVRTGELKETLEGHAALFSSEIYSLAFSPDGKTLASASQDETVRIWPIKKPAAGQK